MENGNMIELLNGNAGKICLIPKGEYSGTETYRILDFVYYKGSSFVAKKTTSGNVPEENNEYWQILAKSGEGGGGSLGDGEYANKEIYGDTSVSLGRLEGSYSGNGSFAFGENVTASGDYSHAEGINTKALAACSHAEGYGTEISLEKYYSHAEGYMTKASSINSHAEGAGTETIGESSHAEGSGTIAAGMYSHTEGENTKSEGTGRGSHAEGFETIASAYYSHAEGYKTTASGRNSHTEGELSSATGVSSHAEGYNATSSSSYSHAEGAGTKASNSGAHAEGYNTEAAGTYSHAEGANTVASANTAHAEGQFTTASGYASHAEGYHTEANNNISHSLGKFNKSMASGGAADTQIGDVFVVGNGNSANAKSNAFRISYDGNVYGTKAFISSGADYAEFIRPWADGNLENEDRVGYFVTVKDGFLYKAGEGDYIVGIVSGNPSVVGNGDEDYYWRYERDKFNRIVMEDVPETAQKTDDEGNPIFDEKTNEPVMMETGKIIRNARMKLSGGYSPELQNGYVERKDRKEWDYVGMLGVLPVRDDGTCEAGKFCKCIDGGIATLAVERGFDTYMVIERISDNVVSVVLK